MTYNPKFDLDLAFGQAGEQWLTMLGAPGGVKIEVKTERDMWFITGNVIFEYRCRGKRSGIAATQADFWVHLLSLDGKIVGMFGWSVVSLKFFLKRCYDNPSAYKSRLAQGGDDGQSSFIIVPISQLYHINFPT